MRQTRRRRKRNSNRRSFPREAPLLEPGTFARFGTFPGTEGSNPLQIFQDFYRPHDAGLQIWGRGFLTTRRRRRIGPRVDCRSCRAPLAARIGVDRCYVRLRDWPLLQEAEHDLNQRLLFRKCSTAPLPVGSCACKSTSGLPRDATRSCGRPHCSFETLSPQASRNHLCGSHTTSGMGATK